MLAVIFFLLIVPLAAQQKKDSSLVFDDISGWMSYLTSDRLKGRVEGSVENREVTDSIAAYFKLLGLKPFKSDNFLQTFYRHPDDSTITTSNVIACLPGTEKPDEYILLSAHFDHVQIGYYNKKDKIYNGANDNASGTSVLLALARQLSMTGPHTRSILFCAFNAEEAGLIGSTHFSENINARQIVAGINLEMLGYPQFGKNTIMLTGMLKSDLYSLLKKRMPGSGIRIRRERGDLFQRSDNYPFAKNGVPAHTLMASDDREPCYHSPCDELKRMNLPNMTSLTIGIQILIDGLLNGADTPKRIDSADLQ
ncbi:M28 family metallopeptidase [Flavihumibacter sp. UBA7668]|uniref:M28 family metallopeptidase n=1 Tax=Flavihumibacter sp. UBA7668 TaxID=1946542 RepID=UPI0025BC1161|nr:M28 family peptidase [Flavihumibacter sp. UBA7668]